MKRLLLGIAALAGLVVLARFAGARLPEAVIWVSGLGVWGPFAFVALYVAATVVLAPGSLLTLAAGAIFGLGRGVVYAFIGATLGASAAFLVSRYLARGLVQRQMYRMPALSAIDRAIEVDGRRIVLLLRLSPVIPFNLLNYGLGLTKVRFVDYVVASVGMLPATLLYVYYGRAAGDLAALAGGARIDRGAGGYALLAVGLIATLVVTTIATRIARRALRAATSEVAP